MKKKTTTVHKPNEATVSTHLEIGKTGIKVGLKNPLTFWQLCILLVLLTLLIAGLAMFVRDLTWMPWIGKPSLYSG